MTTEAVNINEAMPDWDATPTCELDKINPDWGSCGSEATLVAEVGHSMNGCAYAMLAMCEDHFYSVHAKAEQHPIPYTCSGCMGPVDRVTDLIFKAYTL